MHLYYGLNMVYLVCFHLDPLSLNQNKLQTRQQLFSAQPLQEVDFPPDVTAEAHTFLNKHSRGLGEWNSSDTLNAKPRSRLLISVTS